MACHGESEDREPEVPEVPGHEARVSDGLKFYLATAYRWGQTNEHWYHVYCGMDRTKALSLGQCEAMDRGGKYGVCVWEFDADGVNYKRLWYYPSMTDDETGPYHSHKIDFYQRLGFFLNEASQGKALLPDPTNPKHLTYQDVPPLPQYMTDQIASCRRMLEVFEEAQDKTEPNEVTKS